MKKIKSRFVALLMIFTSIISFLPVQFGGRAANAAVSTEATTIRVNAYHNTFIAPKTSALNDMVYTYSKSDQPSFDLTVKNLIETEAQIKSKAVGTESGVNSVEGITYQEVILKSIDGVPITNSDPAKIPAVLTSMGISYENLNGDDNVNKQKVIGKRITGLPYGVNRIEYEVKITTYSITYTPKYDENNNLIVGQGTFTNEKRDTSANTSNDELVIENGTSYAQGQIKDLTFKSYVGSESDFDFDTDTVNVTDNNQRPFLYTQSAEPDKDLPLRYNFNVPDSTKILKYFIKFDQLDTLNASIFIDGKEQSNSVFSAGDGTVRGTLTEMKASKIVIRVSSKNPDDANAPLTKSYAIEINYTRLDANEDYSLVNAGITKQFMNDDSSVAAYVGKKFTIEKKSGIPEYKGDIYVDSRAKQISIEPKLSGSKSNLTYSVSNYFSDNGINYYTLPAALSGGDGKKYVNFQRGSRSNQIQINVMNGSSVVARYLLDVHLTESTASFNLSFSSTSTTKQPSLGQPGVAGSNLQFNASRVTYDLKYSGADTITIKSTGEKSNQYEYIRVFYSNNKDSNDFKETPESLSNDYDKTTLKRSSNIALSLKGYEKIYVQAYYDKFEKKQVKKADGTTGEENVLVGSYPAGSRYVFYLPENYTSSGNTPITPTEDSKDASLTSISISGYTLTSSDGTEGFSSDKTNYTVTVGKADKTAKIIVQPTDYNVKSIEAIISGSQDSYDLYANEENEITLSANGKTTIKIVVTAQDGTTTKTYTIVVRNNAKGNSANLKNIILSTGDFNFDPKQGSTQVRVDLKVSVIQVTPITEDSKSIVTVNGTEYIGSPISVNLKGVQKTEIQIVVKSEDGTESKTYTLVIFRVDVADWDNSGGDNGDKYDDDQFYDDYSDTWVDLKKYEEWGTINGKPAYFDKRGRQVKDAWVVTGGKYYYLNNLGFRASGWKIDEKTGQTYYLDPVTGEMKLGWINIDNRWYYMDGNGVMHKGWLYLNGKWYYSTPNGQAVFNQSMFVDDKVYNFGQDGAVIF